MPFGWVRESKADSNSAGQPEGTQRLRSDPIVRAHPASGLPRGSYVIKQRRGFFGTLWLLIKAAFLLAVGFGACYGLFYFGRIAIPEMRAPELPALTEERKTITVKELENVIEPASDLVTQRYRYTEADIIKSAKELLDFELPLTQDLEVIRYSGVVGVGIDISKVSFEVTEPEGEGKGAIVVTLPALKVVQNEIDEDTFEVDTVMQSPFNPQNIGDATQLLAKLKDEAKDRALQDEEFMSGAQDNAVAVLRNFLDGANVGEYYTIEFVWEEQS